MSKRLTKIHCSFCHRQFSRPTGQAKEAKKFQWKQFCSWRCLSRSKMTGKILTCVNLNCGKKFYRGLSKIKKSKRSFCSLHCAALYNNKERSNKLPPHLCANPTCQIPISRNKKYCSPEHRINPTKTPELEYKNRIIARIRSFYKEEGRIPLKREMNGIYKTAWIMFGSWNKAILAAGLEPNPVIFAKKYFAQDGHKCDSFAEKIIDDWLSEKHIPHKRSVAYPNSSFTADFLAKEKLIEFFGLAGEIKSYDKNIRLKEILARENGFELIKIYPKDLFKLDSVLAKITG